MTSASGARPIAATSRRGHETFAIRDVRDRAEWDDALSALSPVHPLQSWAWGTAKEAVGESVVRVMATDGRGPVALAQVFMKTALRSIRYAWIPRGPVCATLSSAERARLRVDLGRFLKTRRARFVVAKPYVTDALPELGWIIPRREPERTFLIDLADTEAALERKLSKGMKRDRRLLAKAGGHVVQSHDAGAIEPLIALYDSSSLRKGFEQYGDARLLTAVWNAFREAPTSRSGAHVFHAVIAGEVIAAALILTINGRAHYFWGAFDYERRALCASTALQWDAIRTLRQIGVRAYDLEGADRRANPGVFEFKSRLGGELVELPPLRWSPLWNC